MIISSISQWKHQRLLHPGSPCYYLHKFMKIFRSSNTAPGSSFWGLGLVLAWMCCSKLWSVFEHIAKLKESKWDVVPILIACIFITSLWYQSQCWQFGPWLLLSRVAEVLFCSVLQPLIKNQEPNAGKGTERELELGLNLLEPAG